MLKRRETVKTRIKFKDHAIDFEMFCTEPFMLKILEDGGYFINEPEVIAPIVNFVKPGDICIDAGANIGSHSLLLAKIVGDGGQVLSFEPDPHIFKILKDNLELNALEHICYPIPCALWEGNIKGADFYLVHKQGGEAGYECGYSTFVQYANVKQTRIEVDTIALDDIIEPEAKIKLLKIDCEGAEEGILHGAEKLLRRGVDAVICEFNFRISNNDKEIRKYMASLGYDFFYLFDTGQIPECVALEVTFEPSAHKHFFNGLFSTKSFVKENWRYCVAV